MLDNTIVNVALPTMQRDLHAGLSGLQWVVDGYTLVFAALLLTGGTLGDLFGRKRFFLAGLATFTLGSLVCGLSGSLGMLVAGRAVQGLGAAVLMPATLALITRAFADPRERAQALGLWAGVSGIALALGPILGGVLVEWVGWHSIFFVNLPIGVLAFYVAVRLVPESSDPRGHGIDLPGQVLAIAGLGTLTYALIEANTYGWGSPLIVGLFVTAAVAIAAFVAVELRVATPMLDLAFFRNGTFAGANMVGLLVSFGFFGSLVFTTLFFQNVLGYSPIQAGLAGMPCTIAVAVSALFSGRIAGRIGSRLPMAVGMVLMGVGLLLWTQTTSASSYWQIIWALPILGIGNGLVMAPMTAAVMSTVPGERAGMASATTNTMREIGGVFGVALLGALVTRTATHAATTGAVHSAADAFVTGMHVALWVAGLALIAGAGVAALLIRRTSPAAQRDLATGVVADNLAAPRSLRTADAEA
jgi:EmrB/QacA subfamily drug resistance transporter